MTESKLKQRDFFGKSIESKDIKIGPKKERCPYCGKRFIKVDGRHLSRCDEYKKYKEKAKREQKNIIEFCQQVMRKSYPIEQIYPNSWNVNSMAKDEFESLKESIQKTRGEFLKQNPIQIREISNDYYEIIDGEHRWRACKELKFTHIPAIIENDVDIEKAKVMTVVYSRNRGKMDYFKLSKLLNEEYYDKNNKTKCTQKELSERFGLSGKSEVSEVLKIYQRLNNFFDQSSARRTFSARQLIALSRCNDESLREKLIDQSIKNDWSSKEIRKHSTKLNKISKYLLQEIKLNTVRACILKLCTGTSIFELSYDEFIKKIFHLFIENNHKDTIIKFFQKCELHSRIARKFREDYEKSHGNRRHGWYKTSYIKSLQYTSASRMIWDFFQEYYHKTILCFRCKKEILDFKNFVAHHEDYEWDYLWFVFWNFDQKIFPCCTKCHQPGNSKNWKK